MINLLRRRQSGRATSKSRRHAAHKRFLTVRPTIEGLEERIVLSTIGWDTVNHPTGGSWDTGSNWVGGLVPHATDDAVINLPGSGTVTLDAGVTDTVNSMTTNASTSIRIVNDTLSIGTTSSIGGGLNLSGGTLTGTGTLTVSGLITWTGGTMSGTGTTIANGGLTLGAAATSTQMFLDKRTLNNFGTATLIENSNSFGLLLSSGATFHNEPGASFSFLSDSSITSNGGSPAGGTFVNDGTLSKTTGTGTSNISNGITLTDTGAIQISTGTLSLRGGGTLSATATLTAATGTVLDFNGGTYIVLTGASISGVGNAVVSFTGASVTINGTYSVPGLTSVTNGEVDFNVPVTIGTLNQSAGTIAGTGTITVSGLTTWTGGTMSGTGTTIANGGLTLGAAATNTQMFLDKRTLNNFGTATLIENSNSFGLLLSSGATFHNEPGASFSFLSDSSITSNGGSPAGGTFVNDGTLSKTTGTGTSNIGNGITLTDTGAIQISTGTLSLRGGGTLSATATLTAATGTVLDFNGGTYIVPAGASISGVGNAVVSFTGASVTINGTYSVPGLTSVTNGEVDFNVPVTIGTLNQSAGTIAGTGTITVSGLTTWTGGTMSGTGTTIANGGLTLGAAATNTQMFLDKRTLNNFGTATLIENSNSFGLLLSSGATFHNEPGASFSFLSDSSITSNGGSPAGGTFVNDGTLSKTTGTGTSNISNGITLTDTGAIQISTGTLSLRGGGTLSATATLTAATGTVLDFNGGTYIVLTGRPSAGVGNAVVSFTGASVTINGTYSVPGLTSVTNGEVDFNVPVTIGTLNQSAGTIAGTGTITVSGLTTWTGGTMSGTGTTIANGGLTLGAAATNTQMFLDKRTLNNFGTATLIENSNSFGLLLSSGATFHNEPGASFSFLSDSSITSNGGSPAGGTFVNDGTLSKTTGTGTSNVGNGITLTNTGTIQVDTGILSIQGTFTNFSSTTRTLTGGSYIVSGALQFPNADIVANAAAITLSGTTSRIIDGSNLNALRNFATNTAAGSLTILGGRNLTTPGAFSNAGNVTIGTGSAFTASGTYTQSGGSTNLTGGSLTSTNNKVTINGGLLGGNGIVAGNVANGGQVIPGGTGGAGVLNFASNYTQSSGGSLIANLGGASPGTDYGQLVVSGLATLDGTLDVHLINGFAPTNGETFQVLNYDPHSGQFASVVLDNFPVGTTLGASYNASNLILTATVAPILNSIAVAPVNPSVAKGLTKQFTATGTYSDNSTVDLTNQVTWVSASTSVAAISNTAGSQGLATTLTPGTSTITATLGSVSGATTLNVGAAVVTSIAVTPASPSIAKGLTEQFTATGTYSDGTTGDITSSVAWTSSSLTIAIIDATGLASTLSVGTSTITAASGPVSGATIFTVTAAALTSIAVTPANPSIVVGATQQFNATGTYTDGSTADITSSVTWNSSNIVVATISSSGLAAGLTTGSSTINAALGSISSATALTVTAAAPADVTAVSVSWGTVGSASLQTAADQIRLLPGGRSTDMPWLGINKINISLSQAASLTSGDIVVTSAAGLNYGPVTLSGSGTNYVITLAKAINTADRVTMTVGSSTVATFTRRLDVLPGDVNDDGVVTMQDALVVRNQYLGFAPVTIPVILLDVTGDGVVDVQDYNIVRSAIGTKLPHV